MKSSSRKFAENAQANNRIRYALYLKGVDGYPAMSEQEVRESGYALREEVNEVHDIAESLPHVVRGVICVKCCDRWISVAPESVPLKKYECSNCGPGFVVCTGRPVTQNGE